MEVDNTPTPTTLIIHYTTHTYHYDHEIRTFHDMHKIVPQHITTTISWYEGEDISPCDTYIMASYMNIPEHRGICEISDI